MAIEITTRTTIEKSFKNGGIIYAYTSHRDGNVDMYFTDGSHIITMSKQRILDLVFLALDCNIINQDEINSLHTSES